MQTITRAVLAVGLFACVVVSAMQAMSEPSAAHGACQRTNGTCVSLSCTGECGPAFPSLCTCLH
jgi:hypothetical protein